MSGAPVALSSVSGMPSEVMDPPTNSVATLSGPRPSTPTSPAKNVWMSPVRNETFLMPNAWMYPMRSRRSWP